jgi:iron-sulfur cluster assembly protein
MITLTEIAARKVQQHIDKRGRGHGIMIGVRTTGCSGLAYKLEYVDTPPITRDFITYESNGIKVYVNGRDLPYVDGLTMDYNPKEKDRCGCGESFRI